MGKNWAIAIGINSYYSDLKPFVIARMPGTQCWQGSAFTSHLGSLYNLRPLKYARRDAEGIASFCLNEANFQQVDLFAENVPLSIYDPPTIAAN